MVLLTDSLSRRYSWNKTDSALSNTAWSQTNFCGYRISPRISENLREFFEIFGKFCDTSVAALPPVGNWWPTDSAFSVTTEVRAAIFLELSITLPKFSFSSFCCSFCRSRLADLHKENLFQFLLFLSWF